MKWKLTITQKKKSDFSDSKLEYDVVFQNDSLIKLGIIVEKLAECEEAEETVYRIEKVGDE